MKKLIFVIVALALISSSAYAEGNYHRRPHGNHNNWNGHDHNYHHGGHYNYWHGGHNNYYHGGNNNFYNDPNFWGGVAGGLIGGTIINGIQNQPECYWTQARVYDPNTGYYLVRPVEVCN